MTKNVFPERFSERKLRKYSFRSFSERVTKKTAKIDDLKILIDKGNNQFKIFPENKIWIENYSRIFAIKLIFAIDY